jgi:hypothetical protein
MFASWSPYSDFNTSHYPRVNIANMVILPSPISEYVSLDGAFESSASMLKEMALNVLDYKNAVDVARNESTL